MENERYERLMDIPGTIFVFGSNLAGKHGSGAARAALDNYGAIYGMPVGLQGRSYAIPTKDENIESLPLEVIENFVRKFLHYAVDHPEYTFVLTRVGCVLAGYTNEQIAPMFMRTLPANCIAPTEWLLIGRREWTTSAGPS